MTDILILLIIVNCHSSVYFYKVTGLFIFFMMSADSWISPEGGVSSSQPPVWPRFSSDAVCSWMYLGIWSRLEMMVATLVNTSKLEDTSGSCGSLIRASWFHLVVLVAPPDEGLGCVQQYNLIYWICTPEIIESLWMQIIQHWPHWNHQLQGNFNQSLS